MTQSQHYWTPTGLPAKVASPLGIASLVIGIFAALFCWIPFCGMGAIPVAAIGAILAIVGLVISLSGQKSGVGFPLAGLIVCLLAIGIAVFSTAITSAGIGAAGKRAQEANRATTNRTAPTATVTADQIVKGYASNEVSADSLYKGKLVEVSGTVETIKRDIVGSPFITLAASDPLRRVQCSFSESSASDLVGLQPGQVVRVRGICRGLMVNVQLQDCALQN